MILDLEPDGDSVSKISSTSVSPDISKAQMLPCMVSEVSLCEASWHEVVTPRIPLLSL